MSIIKRYRKESLGDDGIATIYLKTSFLGIPVYEDKFDTTNNNIINQFIDFSAEQPTTGLYDVTNIGFRRNNYEKA